MAVRSFKQFVEQEMGWFMHFLIYAILEWFLIVLLFVDGFLAFFANEFCKFFELRIPCLLCTRIDHVLVQRNHDFYYNDSICEVHKKDVSYLAFCHIHRKLSDIRRMCEGCLLSFATGKVSDCDTYKSLVGILHKDVECFVDDDQKRHLRLPVGRKDKASLQLEKSSFHLCSCCGDLLKLKTCLPKSSTLSHQMQVSQAPTPSPREPFSMMTRNENSRNLDLPHIRYTELKVMPDSENEIFHDDEDAATASLREDPKSATVPLLVGTEDLNDDASKTPNFARGNRFFGIPLSDSPSSSPRWANRLQRKSPLSDPSSDVVEGTAGNEPDGESILHRLKRQVRLDRKSLMALYMELDEERSASAVAANNAMAMITRLQAEKAAVQMEALQYQRMMEEQAEYDEEALQYMQDLLNKRDEEIKALESDLTAYRERYGVLGVEDIVECDPMADNDYQELKAQSHSSTSERYEGMGSPSPLSCSDPNSCRAGSPLKELKVGDTRDESLSHFDTERFQLADRLKNLEKKIHFWSSNGDKLIPPTSNPVDDKEESRVLGPQAKAMLTRELSMIGERLKTLEADSGFLKEAAQALRNGGDGTTLLAEIADNLRKIRSALKEPTVDMDA